MAVVEWVRYCFPGLCFPRLSSDAKPSNLVFKRNKKSFQAVFSMTLHDSSMTKADLSESNHSISSQNNIFFMLSTEWYWDSPCLSSWHLPADLLWLRAAAQQLSHCLLLYLGRTPVPGKGSCCHQSKQSTFYTVIRLYRAIKRVMLVPIKYTLLVK